MSDAVSLIFFFFGGAGISDVHIILLIEVVKFLWKNVFWNQMFGFIH